MSAIELIILIILVAIVLVVVLSRKDPSGASARMETPPLSQEETDRQVRDYLARGMKINAIKAYRDYYKVGLKEAKDAVEALEPGIITGIDSTAGLSGWDSIAPPSTGDGLGTSPDESKIRVLLGANRKIEAIKVYRQHHLCDLMTAKNAVEAIEREMNLGR
jgi:ribosomal protein L7/L12